MEFSDLETFHGSDHMLQRLLDAGMTPIITHPERNPQLQQRFDDIARWVESGCCVQVTAGSHLGAFGRKAKTCAQELLKRGLTHVVASDAHDCEKRTPDLSGAYRHLADEWGEDLVRPLFVDNPRAIVDGHSIDYAFEAPPSQARKWFHFGREPDRTHRDVRRRDTVRRGPSHRGQGQTTTVGRSHAGTTRGAARRAGARNIRKGSEGLMYQQFYGLNAYPFEITPNPRYLVLTATHREVLCALEYAMTAKKAITLVIGEAGTGKTTLLRKALGVKLRSSGAPAPEFIYINNPTLTPAELIERLLIELCGTAVAGSKTAMLKQLEDTLLARQAANRPAALIVDEAQGLPDVLLEELRYLTNLESDDTKLLPLILAGQPELAARLDDHRWRQLKQRIALRCQLAPLEMQETAATSSAGSNSPGGRWYLVHA